MVTEKGSKARRRVTGLSGVAKRGALSMTGRVSPTGRGPVRAKRTSVRPVVEAPSRVFKGIPFKRVVGGA